MIKKIYTFGTSFTHGGGFEWDCLSSDVNDKLKKNYSHIDIPKNQFDFSWPGFLQRYLGKDVEVINLAKSGFGNELIYRKVFDLVTSSDFKKDECLFLFESRLNVGVVPFIDSRKQRATIQLDPS